MGECVSVSVKNQNEFWLYYTFQQLGILGELTIDSVDPAESTIDDYKDMSECLCSLNSADLALGINPLFLSIFAKAIGNKPFVVEVTGKDNSATPANATVEVTIPAFTQIGQLMAVPEPSTGKKWTSVTSVLIKGTQPTDHEATLGAGIKILMLPPKSSFETRPLGGLINFDNGFKFSTGTTRRAIPNKFNPSDHIKRQRGENSFSVSQLYTVFGESLQFLRDRDFTMLVEVHVDGATNIFESYYFNKVSLNVPLSIGGDGANASMDADGTFSEFFVL